MPFYRNILKQAWQLTWHNKYLWWFGVFAALLGNGGELEILFNNAGANPSQAIFPSWQRIAATGVFKWQTFANIGNLLKTDALNITLVLLSCLAVLAILLFLVWLVIVAQAALVNNSAAVIRQKKNNFRDGLAAGLLNFWPVFGLNVLVKAVIYVLLVAVSLPVIFFQTSFSANVFYIIALVIMVPLAIVLSFIIKYAIAYVVIDKSRVVEALGQSWRLFKNNWLISFEMAVILFAINLLVGLAIILVILTLAVPFLFLGLIFHYAFSVVGSWLIAALAFACFIATIVFTGAALSVFQVSSWTGLFLELDSKGGTAKLVRLINKTVRA